MPSIIRLHLSENLAPGTLTATSPAQAHYLGAVMRRKPGDTIHIFNATDGEFAASITTITRHAATLAITAQTRAPTPEPDCWLAFAPVKRDQTNLIIEKATELGVAAIHPILTQHTQTARLNPERLAAIATEAAEQSERLSVPTIHPALPLATFLAQFPADRRLFVAAERTNTPALSLVSPFQPHALLIGPEGGFAPTELDTMAQLGFVTLVSLGPRILRAETAAIAGLARMLAAPV